MTRIIVHITDDSVGIENKPEDVEVLIQDHRRHQVELYTQGTPEEQLQVSFENGERYVAHRFEASR